MLKCVNTTKNTRDNSLIISLGGDKVTPNRILRLVLGVVAHFGGSFDGFGSFFTMVVDVISAFVGAHTFVVEATATIVALGGFLSINVRSNCKVVPDGGFLF